MEAAASPGPTSPLAALILARTGELHGVYSARLRDCEAELDATRAALRDCRAELRESHARERRAREEASEAQSARESAVHCGLLLAEEALSSLAETEQRWAMERAASLASNAELEAQLEAARAEGAQAAAQLAEERAAFRVQLERAGGHRAASPARPPAEALERLRQDSAALQALVSSPPPASRAALSGSPRLWRLSDEVESTSLAAPSDVASRVALAGAAAARAAVRSRGAAGDRVSRLGARAALERAILELSSRHRAAA